MLAGVRASPEFIRIKELPRRAWSEDAATELASALTQLLKTPYGTMSLRPLQAVALTELALYGGLLGPICVGYGKTLITLLAPYVMNSTRPVLLLPAKLIEKTRNDQKMYLEHWKVSPYIHMKSYESLGRVSHATWLEKLQPDLLICDEGHFLKNTRAAVTRRVKRFVEKQKIPFVVMSGTLTSKSLHDFAHLSRWALHDNAPLPNHFADLQDWANAVDHRTEFALRTAPGVLSEFADGSDDLNAVRSGVQKRITDTPGVVATSGDSVSCSLRVERSTFEVPDNIQEHFKSFRETWETPDGWAMISALETFKYACQLALGFYYRMDPRPPSEWLDCRRAWATFVRHVLAHNRRGLDSPLAVSLACSKNELDREQYDAWKEIKSTFKPNTVAVWLSDYAIDQGVQWIKENPSGGLVFSFFREFGRRLASVAGVPYCGAGGLTDDGRYIENFEGQTLVCSLGSNKEGRNLQTHWSKGLVPNPPSTGSIWEQLLGRLHRPGQLSDEVQWTVWDLCDEHAKAFSDSRAKAEYIGRTTGQIQKLQYADLVGWA